MKTLPRVRLRTLSAIAGLTLTFFCSAFIPSPAKGQEPPQAKVMYKRNDGKQELWGFYDLTKSLKGSCSVYRGGMFLGRIADFKRDPQLPERVLQVTGLSPNGLVVINIETALYEENWLPKADLIRFGQFFIKDREVRIAYSLCRSPSGTEVNSLDGIWQEKSSGIPSVFSRPTAPVPVIRVPAGPQSETVSRAGRHIKYSYGGKFGKYDVADTAEAYDGQQLIARAQAIALQDSPGGGPRTLKISVTHLSASGSAYEGYVYIQAGFGGGRLVREEDVSGRKQSTIFSTWPFGH